MIQDLSEILDEGARHIEAVYRAYGWTWPFGATPRVPDAIDIRRALEGLADEMAGLACGRHSYKELVLEVESDEHDDTRTWRVSLKMAEGEVDAEV